ncbi:MAG TPA: tetratricopeptide repeat protein [Burkholderiales bacterium]|nr:tetratricopeptide repeat protein [Burkholderiales bacterium]
MRILLFALALTMAAPAAFPEPPGSREQALAGLRSDDAATRAEALVWIANRGTPADDGLLHERLRDESALVRSYAEQALWLLWSRSGDADIDRIMARGVEEMQAGRHAAAIATFSGVISHRPGFAEAWNKRATVYYLAGDYRRSLADCDEVLKRNPRHFGALSGAGMVHVALEEYEEAQRAFRRALEVNPNMVGVELELLKLEERLKGKRKLST